MPCLVVAGQLMRRCRSPGTNARTPANSLPSPVVLAGCSPSRLGSRLSTTLLPSRAGSGRHVITGSWISVLPSVSRYRSVKVIASMPSDRVPHRVGSSSRRATRAGSPAGTTTGGPRSNVLGGLDRQARVEVVVPV